MSDPVPCREQVAVNAKAALTAISGLTVERNRRDPIHAEDDLNRAILFEGDEMPENVFCGQDGYRLPFLVQVALPGSGEEAATAANVLRAKIVKGLCADRTLGGKTSDLQIIEPGDWIGVDVDVDNYEGFFLAFEVRYATVEGDPFTFS
jgi:hypothetical protein